MLEAVDDWTCVQIIKILKEVYRDNPFPLRERNTEITLENTTIISPRSVYIVERIGSVAEG